VRTTHKVDVDCQKLVIEAQAFTALVKLRQSNLNICKSNIMSRDYQSFPEPTAALGQRDNRKTGPSLLVWVTAIAFMFFGLILAIFVTIWIPTYANIVAQRGIRDKYAPDPNSPAFQDWLTNDGPDDPVTYKIFWMYNITNAHDVMYNGSNPTFVECGPFVYQMHVHKLNVDLSVDTEATYTEWTYFSWVGTSPVTLDNPDGTNTTYVSQNPDEELITN